jgi:hypothetical protein
MAMVGLAKVQLGADAEAVVWMRRGLDANWNISVAHFDLAAALARLGKLDEARAAVNAGLALDPRFTIRRYRDVTYANSNNPTYRAGRERLIEGMRLAGVPEGVTFVRLTRRAPGHTLVPQVRLGTHVRSYKHQPTPHRGLRSRCGGLQPPYGR